MKKKKSLRKKHRLKKKKSLLENNIVCGAVLFLFLFIGFVYLFVLHPLFQVDNIILEDVKEVDESLIANIVEKNINKELPLFTSRSVFLVSGNKIRENILNDVSIIKNVSIKKVFPAEIKIETEKRIPFAIWCKAERKEDCYYLDRSGVIFQKIDGFRKGFLVILIRKNFTKGDTVIDKDQLEKITLIDERLSKEDIKASYFQIKAGEKIEVYTNYKWKIYFSLNNIEKELENLKIAIDEIERGELLEYIDLRFGDRIYYK